MTYPGYGMRQVSKNFKIKPSKIVSVTKGFSSTKGLYWMISDGHFMHEVYNDDLTEFGHSLVEMWSDVD